MQFNHIVAETAEKLVGCLSADSASNETVGLEKRAARRPELGYGISEENHALAVVGHILKFPVGRFVFFVVNPVGAVGAAAERSRSNHNNRRGAYEVSVHCSVAIFDVANILQKI